MGRDTRQRILDAAAALFAERGYDATSLREVAGQVGVTKAAVYHHFADKEELLRTLLEPLDELQEHLLALVEGPLDRDTWARSCAEAADWLGRHADLFRLLERNRGAINTLNAGGDDLHDRLRRRTAERFGDRTVPLEDRVRAAAAISLATTAGTMGARFGADQPEVVRSTIGAALRAVLELDPLPS